jgi:HPt (histidine-containing phosphotransfer) domain-containing protein
MTRPWDKETAYYEFGDEETARMAIDELIDNAKSFIEEIHSALTGGDVNRIRQRAHAIKGGAATVEAGPLFKAIAELEAL